MIRIDGLEALEGARHPSVVTIGKFFAVHVGHQALLRATCAAARRRGVTVGVLTFDRHPQEILRPGTRYPILTSLEERLALIAAQGVDYTVVIRLDGEFLNRTPEEFAHGVLAERLRAVEVLVGEGFRFGRGAVGTSETLRALGEAAGFEVTVVPPVLVGGAPASTSRVAECVRSGRVEATTELLGRHYTVPGTVMRGDRRGHQLGFPTANLRVDPQRLLPADGVYAGWAVWGDERRGAVANLGCRPTVDGTRHMVEAHLFDFHGDLYGADLRLEFAHRLRDEQRFPSLDALRAQISQDASTARRLLGVG